MQNSDTSSSDWQIRHAVLRDVNAIFGLIRAHQDDLILRPIGDIIANIDRFFVAEKNGRIVGCASWKILPEIGSPESASVEVQSVAVEFAYRRSGIGKGLVERILEEIRQFDFPHAIVLTFAPNFFRSLGFHEISKTKVMHKLYTGCIGCTKYADPFSCPEIAMQYDLRVTRGGNCKTA